MTAPAALPVETVEVLDEADGETRVRFPVVVIEGYDTSDGRYLTPGGLTHRALPISLLAQIESGHGGDEPGPAVLVGRIDTLERTPGPEVTSPRTGEPFPEGSFVWSGTGAVSTSAVINGHNVADLVRRRFLRGVSVDLVGMDYEVVGEGGMAVDEENPQRQLIAHKAEIAAATLCAVPAFSDAYVEVAGDETTDAAALPQDMSEGLVASALPAWRSSEVGDYAVLTAAAEPAPLVAVTLPVDAADQLAAVIDDGDGDSRDAPVLARAIVDFITSKWQDAQVTPDAEDPPEMADQAADPNLGDAAEVDGGDAVGMPDVPQDCLYGDSGPHPATQSLLFSDSTQYVATCEEHDPDGRADVEAEGFTVDQVVLIAAGDEGADEPAGPE